MKLYHFTSPMHIEGCRNSGIIMGMIVTAIDPPESKRGFQWLTDNPDWDQAWDRAKNLPYDRTMFRITVKIPKKSEGDLVHFTSDEAKELMPKAIYDAMAGYEGSESWWIFKGQIPRKWINKTNRKPEELQQPIGQLAEPTKEHDPVKVQELWDIIASARVRQDLGGENAFDSQMFIAAANSMMDYGITGPEFIEGLAKRGYRKQEVLTFIQKVSGDGH